jgi:hypothetical protein
MENPHHELARQYFDYLARRFPVMCASDEFHFLPRAQGAHRCYDQLDDLGSQSVAEAIDRIKTFKREFVRAERCEQDAEIRVDLALLKANASGILIEFETNRSWCCNPMLYLKIAFIGLDHALTKPAADSRERLERTAARLNSVPRLLRQGMENLKDITWPYHRAARSMAVDCIAYIDEIENGLGDGIVQRLEKGLRQTRSATRSFDAFLSGHPRRHPHRVDQPYPLSPLEVNLNEHFQCKRSVAEIYEIAVDQWHDSLDRLTALQSRIDRRKSWQQLYHDYYPTEPEAMDTASLYRDEIDRMRLFFADNGFAKKDLISPLVFSETPTYLRSVRASASFGAAFSPDPEEKSFFFMTTRLPGTSDPLETGAVKKRLHREYKFLTAHETVPGHHLLDSIRRRLCNPVRRQIESPLFYEGWASYAESLLADTGYIRKPMEYVVDYKRRLWRSARCRIDSGLPIGVLTRENAEKLLLTTGFAAAEARRQINRFQLNPGYQLCYTLGCYEIMRLKARYGPRMGSTAFHTFLMEGGQLPFHVIEKRLEALSGQ